MSRNTTALIALAVLCCAAYAIVLQTTGQHAEAERFVEWAGGGLATLVVFLVFFGDDS